MPQTRSQTPRSERPATPPRAARRKRAPLATAAAETLVPAFVFTVLFHLLLFKGVAASGLFSGAPASAASEAKAPRPLPVQIAPANTPVPANLLPPSMRPTPPKFVHVNPLAPSLKPDKTNNTGAADQRAAQREPDPLSKAERPRMKGEEPDSTRIVQAVPRDRLPPALQPEAGQPLGRPVEQTTPTAPSAPKPEAAAKAADGPEARPDLPVGKPVADAKGVPFAEKPGVAKPESVGKADKKPDTATPEKREGAKTGEGEAKEAAKPKAEISVAPTQPGQPTPRPRPRATLAGTSGPLGISLAAAPDRGALDAQNSVFSRMGEYASRMFEIIQAAWWAGVDRMRVTETGTVVVEFTLHKDGSVSDAHIVSRTTSERAAYLCLDSVTGRAPFDPWPDDMIGMFGEKQKGRLTFHYH